MMQLLGWVTPSTVQTLGWTLVHFLWQGAAIAVVTYGVLAFVRSALIRYNVALAALVLMSVSPMVTFTFLQNGDGGSTQGSSVKQALDIIRAIPDSTIATA